MLVRHRGVAPTIDPGAWIAPTAVIVGDVRIEAGARVLWGAVVSAEDGSVVIGGETVIMENALVRGRDGHAASIGSSVMIGPHAHVNGSQVHDGAFIATGAALFPGSRVGAGAEVRIHGVVQVGTVIEPGAVVPIGWVAVGNPARIPPPERHDDIWATQRTLDFPGTVYGVPRGAGMDEIMRRQSRFFGAHEGDEIIS